VVFGPGAGYGVLNVVHRSTGHEGPDGQEMCSSTLSLTSALDGGEPAPVAARSNT